MSINILSSCEKPYIDKNKRAYRCGQCPNCRKMYVLEWSLRIRHELIKGVKPLFITPTYRDTKLTKNRETIAEFKGDCRATLKEKDMQLYIKKVRKALHPIKIKYIYCGEYGEKRMRPHYHMLMWSEEVNLRKYENIIREKWENGINHIDDKEITDNAVQYIIGYVKKKIGSRYGGNKKYIENGRVAPYFRTSQGIGKKYLEENIEDITNNPKFRYRKMIIGIPRYYIKLIKKKEGINFKSYNIIRENNEIKIVKKYVTIENPYGKYTRRLYNAQIKNYENNREKTIESYKAIEKKEIEEMYDRDYKKFLEELLEKYRKYNEYKFKDIFERVASTVNRIDRDKEKYEKVINIPDGKKEVIEQLKQIAITKNNYIRGGAFGKRNKIA